MGSSINPKDPAWQCTSGVVPQVELSVGVFCGLSAFFSQRWPEAGKCGSTFGILAREGEKNEIVVEKEEKARNVGSSTVRSLHPSRSQNSTSNNWPKSKLAEVDHARQRVWGGKRGGQRRNSLSETVLVLGGADKSDKRHGRVMVKLNQRTQCLLTRR